MMEKDDMVRNSDLKSAQPLQYRVRDSTDVEFYITLKSPYVLRESCDEESLAWGSSEPSIGQNF